MVKNEINLQIKQKTSSYKEINHLTFVRVQHEPQFILNSCIVHPFNLYRPTPWKLQMLCTN